MKRNVLLAISALIVIAVVGIGLSQFASSQPDGLEYVAESHGFADTAQDHALEDSPFAGYGEQGVSLALGATVGIALTLGLGYGLFKILGRPDPQHASSKE